MTPEGLSAQAVAELVGGRLLGDGTAVLRRVAPLDRAGPDALAFVASSRFVAEFRASAAGAVLVPAAIAEEPEGPATRIVVAEPYRGILAALRAMYPPAPAEPGIHPTAVLGPGVELGADVSVGPRAVLGSAVRLGDRVRIAAGAVVEDGVVIGADTVVGPGAICYRGARIGARVILKAGAVVGGDGFGYVSGASGHERLPHIGGCVLEDDVEVGSNSTIDRGSIGDTVIGQGTKIDNLVQIGHNVRIGARCLIMGMVGIGGSTRVGNGVIMAGKAAIADHLVIGDGARIGAAALVITDVPAGVDWSGYPGRRHREALRTQAAMLRLPALLAQLEALVRERARRE